MAFTKLDATWPDLGRDMAKLTYITNVSLDGFIEDPDGLRFDGPRRGAVVFITAWCRTG